MFAFIISPAGASRVLSFKLGFILFRLMIFAKLPNWILIFSIRFDSNKFFFSSDPFGVLKKQLKDLSNQSLISQWDNF